MPAPLLTSMARPACALTHHLPQTSQQPLAGGPLSFSLAGPDDVQTQHVHAGQALYGGYLQQVKCFSMMPQSGKIVVFDTQLLVKKAFYALVQNGMRSAPLWDSHKQQFVGMITITGLHHSLLLPVILSHGHRHLCCWLTQHVPTRPA